MAEGNQTAQTKQPGPGDKRRQFPFLMKKLFHKIWNRLGLGYMTEETRDVGGLQEEEVIKKFRDLYDLNKKRIDQLKIIEQEWGSVYEPAIGIIPGGEEGDTILGLYRTIGIYNDIDIAKLEAQAFQFGTVRLVEEEVEAIKELRKRDSSVAELKSFKLVPSSITVIWEKFGSIRGHQEKITALGYSTIDNLTPLVADLVERVRNTQEVLVVPMPPRNALNQLLNTLSASLKEIRRIEIEHFKYLNDKDRVISQLEKISGKRDFILQHSSHTLFKQTRFSHTYKVIKPLVILPAGVQKIIERDESGEERVVSKPIFKPIYFNPVKNPYTEELNSINENIASINEGDISVQIRSIERLRAGLIEYLRKFDEKYTKKLDEYIKDTVKTLMISSGIPAKYQELIKQNPGIRENIQNLLNDVRARLTELMKRELLIIINLDQDSRKNKINQLMGDLSQFLKEVKIKEEDINKLIGNLTKRLKDLERTEPKDFKKAKNDLIEDYIKRLNELGVDTGISIFRDIISQLCDYSSTNIEQAVERLTSQVIDDLQELKIEDDDILKLIDIIEKNIQNIIDNVKKTVTRISQLRNRVNIDKINSRINEYSQQLSSLNSQIDTLNFLRNRKQELEKDIRDLKPNHPNFVPFDDEVDWGLDENGWPLEVDEEGVVLLDKWWEEISRNEWQRSRILKKQGGAEVWKNKVTNGVKKHGVRKIDKRFVGNLDLLDTSMFIENEWDSYRDDYRDGRYHPHSKTLADYLIAAKEKKIIPTKDIHLHFDPMKEYVEWDPGKNLDVPDDEKLVTRDYKMRVFDTERNQWVMKSGTRSPKHLNPAFDRAALHSGIIHWGRMYYYENTEGINRWSENPFPHISSRGVSHWLIDFTIRKTYNIEEAANALRNREWDYGRRHFTTINPETSAGPLITAPLDEGGVAPE